MLRIFMMFQHFFNKKKKVNFQLVGVTITGLETLTK